MELIRNGYFESGELEPWQPCMGMALEGGGVTDENPVFLSEYNLRLRGNDCVRQQLPYYGSVAGGELGLWLMVYHLDRAPGSFEARVEYADGGDRSVGTVTHDLLHDRRHPSNPYHLRVAVDPDRYVTALRLRCIEAGVPWYVCAVTMEGSYVFPGAPGPARMSMADRLARLERRMARIEQASMRALGQLARPKRDAETRKTLA